jgi:hypothetical protein
MVFHGGDQPSTQTTSPAVRCALCDRPARVHILKGYDHGRPIRQSLCLSCANAADERLLSETLERRQRRSGRATLLTVTGLLLIVLGGAVDQLGIHTSVGFGLKQQTSLLLGAFVVILGALLRIDVLAALGALLFAAAALADVLKPGGSPGVGWQQGAALVVGLLCLVAGLVNWTHREPRRQPGAAP